MVKFKDFSRPLSAFQVLFKANLIFKDFSIQYCILKYFSSLCEPCYRRFNLRKDVLFSFDTFFSTAKRRLSIPVAKGGAWQRKVPRTEVYTQHQSLAFCIVRFDSGNLLF